MASTLCERLASRGIRLPTRPLLATRPVLANPYVASDAAKVARALPQRRASRAPHKRRVSTDPRSPVMVQSGVDESMSLALVPYADKDNIVAPTLGDAHKPPRDSLSSHRQKARKRKQHASPLPGQGTLTKWLRRSPQTPAFTPRRNGSSMKKSRASNARSSSPHALLFSSASEKCAICCDDVTASEAVRLRCQHGWYCTQCMSRHIEARLDVGTVQATCPECNTELPERDLKRIVPQRLVERLLTRSLEQAVASTENLRPCPTPNCPMRIALEADDDGHFKCTACKKESCLRCGAQPYHKRMTCEQYAEHIQKKNRRCSFLKWMRDTGTKQCPSCQMAVTKQNMKHQGTQRSECHKMLCRNCGTRFCFKCLAILTKDYTCGCTKDEHGFVDPDTGEYVHHLKKKTAKAAGQGKENKRNKENAPVQEWRHGGG